MDYGKIIWDLIPTVTVSGRVYPSLSFGQPGWLIRRGFFNRNAFVHSTEEFDAQFELARRNSTKITTTGKVISRGMGGKVLIILPLSVE